MRQILFKIPFLDVPIYGYGAMVLAGVVAALWILGRAARNRGWMPGVAPDNAIWIVLAGLLGGRTPAKRGDPNPPLTVPSIARQVTPSHQ